MRISLKETYVDVRAKALNTTLNIVVELDDVE